MFKPKTTANGNKLGVIEILSYYLLKEGKRGGRMLILGIYIFMLSPSYTNKI